MLEKAECTGDQLIISKVINNNVVSAYDDEQHELVIMGRGIAFQKKSGDPIDEERIEKYFPFKIKIYQKNSKPCFMIFRSSICKCVRQLSITQERPLTKI